MSLPSYEDFMTAKTKYEEREKTLEARRQSNYANECYGLIESYLKSGRDRVPEPDGNPEIRWIYDGTGPWLTLLKERTEKEGWITHYKRFEGFYMVHTSTIPKWLRWMK